MKYVRFINRTQSKITVIPIELISLAFADYYIVVKFINGEEIKKYTKYTLQEAEEKYTSLLISDNKFVEYEVFNVNIRRT